MPTIRGETDRPIRLWPALDVQQAAGLAASALCAWAIWRSGLPAPLRTGLGLLAAAAGAGLSVGRWPPGPGGERLGLWLWRALRHALRPRWWSAERAASLLGPGPDGDRPGGGGARSAVWACDGQGHPGRGLAAQAAAGAAYVQFLHALDRPLQVVSAARPLAEADRPPSWDPARAPAHLRAAAEAFAAHWSRLVAAQRTVVRTCFTVLPAPGAPPAAAASPASDAVAAFLGFAARVGLEPRPVGDGALGRWLGAAAGTRGDPAANTGAAWVVTRDGGAAR